MKAHIIVNDQLVSSSKQGLLAFVGIEDNDTEKDVDSMVQRILQTTLWAEECEPKCRNRNASGPSDITDFIRVHHQYQCLVKKLSNTYRPERVKSGVLEAMMALPFIDDAPIRIYYESTDSVV
ncbi:hypothetical protein DPV78_009177 [Talaromyces pinophilus]|nr:hypothetical protein DPV78_009177 [Talaromyces pinophilus]